MDSKRIHIEQEVGHLVLFKQNLSQMNYFMKRYFSAERHNRAIFAIIISIIIINKKYEYENKSHEENPRRIMLRSPHVSKHHGR